MKSLENFYTEKSCTKKDINNYSYQVVINKNHEVFEGHFPDNPITPGVCMMYIIKELTSKLLNHKLQLVTASNIKFMALINPNINPEITIDLVITENEGEIKVKNITSFEDTVALKLNAKYKKIV